MIASIDRFGRLVIPKSIRDRLGLRPGAAVQIEEAEGQITIQPLQSRPQLERAADGMLILNGDLEFPIDDPIEYDRSMRQRMVLRLENH